MKNKVLDIRTYAFSEQDRLLLDTNVWLQIYADKTNPSPITKLYSQAFDMMLQAKCSLFIDVIIFSEFVSNFVRLRNLKTAKKFKEFRNSKYFPEVAKETAEVARDMLQHCLRINDDFLGMHLENLLNNFENHPLDIKDQLLLEICKNHQVTLVTDDSDFKNADCLVLTANQNLLSG